MFGGGDQCQQHHNCCFPFPHKHAIIGTNALQHCLFTSRSFFFQQKMAMTIPRHLIDVDVSEAARADRRGISAKKRISTFLSIITSSRSNISRVGAQEQENAGCGLVAQDSLRGISYTDYVPSRAPSPSLWYLGGDSANPYYQSICRRHR